MVDVAADAPPRSAPVGPAWSSRATRGAWLLAGLGAVLRVRQYLVDRSLWRDEASLVWNILHRGYTGFSRPLAFEQGTPPGFFVVEKAVSQVLGSSELALRAVPLLCSLAALAVAVVLVRRHLDAPSGLVALALCATSPSLIYFASEVKQYSSDSLVALLVLLAASSAWRRDFDRRSCVVLALAGAAAVPCSHAAVFVLAGVGPVLAWSAWRSRAIEPGRLWRVLAVGITWAVVWGGVYASFERHLDSDTFLRDFWRQAFLPLPPTDSAGWHRWTDAMSTLFRMLVGNPALIWVVAPLALVGLVTLLQRRPAVAAVVLLTWGTVVVASSRSLYPATERLVLFLLPLLAVLVGTGTARVATALAARSELLGPAFAIVVVVLCAAVGLHRFGSPEPVEELRPLLQSMDHESRAGDAVYVSETAVAAYDYYRDRLSIDDRPVVDSTAGIDDMAALDRDAARMSRYARVWVVTSAYWQPEGHTTPDLLAAFDRVGTRVEQHVGPGATVVLYQMRRGT